jgi:predicted PurR-regulated permease PerM
VSAEDITAVVASNQDMNYKKKVTDIAKQIVENKLNDQLNTMLENKLGKTLKSLGINFSFKDRNTIQDIIDIIRGQKYVKFNEQKFLDGLQKTLEKKVDELIVQKVNKYVDEYANKINAKIDEYSKKITDKLDTYRKKVDKIVDKLSKWDTEATKLNIAAKLDNLIKSPVDKIANILNTPDKFLGKLGLNLGLGDMFKQVTQVYTKGMAEKIQKVFQPAVNKALAITKKISETITKVIDAVNKLRDKAKQMIEKWKNQIKSMVQEQTKKLVNEIVKYVKLNITSGLGGGFKI